MEPTDRDLVDRVTRGDEEAFGLLFERHRAPVHRHLLRILRDASWADDLTQEVFLRLWQRSDQWNADAGLRSWLLRIATNLALNHLRATKRRREQPIEIRPPAEEDEDDRPVPGWMVDTASRQPDEALDRTEQRRLLDRTVSQLSEGKQEVLRLLCEGHLDTRQVAVELGIPEGTVKSRLHHARQEIARSWQELGIEWEDL
ncbi:MAG: RNA polymerase sigma factor [Gemmatimonadota bacterium]